MFQQLLLPLQHPGQNTFSNFHPGNNGEMLRALQQLLQDKDGHIIALEGRLGKTHLLQASAYFGIQQGWSVSYFPLTKIKQIHPDMLLGSSNSPLTCIDDLDALADEPDWQEAFLSALHLLLVKRQKVVFSQHASLDSMCTFRKDLWKKLRLATHLKITFPNANQGMKLLTFRACELNLIVTNKAANFLWSNIRTSKQLNNLFKHFSKFSGTGKFTIQMAKDWWFQENQS